MRVKIISIRHLLCIQVSFLCWWYWGGSPLFCLPSLKKRTQHFLFCVQVLKEGRGEKKTLRKRQIFKKKGRRGHSLTLFFYNPKRCGASDTTGEHLLTPPFTIPYLFFLSLYLLPRQSKCTFFIFSLFQRHL